MQKKIFFLLLCSCQIIMHKPGPFTNSGVSNFVKLVVVYTKHQQLNNCQIGIGAL